MWNQCNFKKFQALRVLRARFKALWADTASSYCAPLLLCEWKERENECHVVAPTNIVQTIQPIATLTSYYNGEKKETQSIQQPARRVEFEQQLSSDNERSQTHHSRSSTPSDERSPSPEIGPNAATEALYRVNFRSIQHFWCSQRKSGFQEAARDRERSQGPGQAYAKTAQSEQLTQQVFADTC
ncbi:hypothetical protein B0H17DRAFT_1147587 [Mycena rosella]|uniref:Uncharacterized protein n=1 Tax=Mycena rosella TaxID=1033263 RepID=A0AAD7CLH2_MYCRO|nr:hypothetical protein B0H17DRAFT_1147587 [Mycena rosella]